MGSQESWRSQQSRESTQSFEVAFERSEDPMGNKVVHDEKRDSFDWSNPMEPEHAAQNVSSEDEIVAAPKARQKKKKKKREGGSAVGVELAEVQSTRKGKSDD